MLLPSTVNSNKKSREFKNTILIWASLFVTNTIKRVNITYCFGVWCGVVVVTLRTVELGVGQCGDTNLTTKGPQPPFRTGKDETTHNISMKIDNPQNTWPPKL